jgi:hypothetical protein
MEKRSLKSSASLVTDITDDPESSNISSNGEDTPKATILGNPLHKFMPQTSSRPTIASAC